MHALRTHAGSRAWAFDRMFRRAFDGHNLKRLRVLKPGVVVTYIAGNNSQLPDTTVGKRRTCW